VLSVTLSWLLDIMCTAEEEEEEEEEKGEMGFGEEGLYGALPAAAPAAGDEVPPEGGAQPTGSCIKYIGIGSADGPKPQTYTATETETKTKLCVVR
jgi:hypothetical protein